MNFARNQKLWIFLALVYLAIAFAKPREGFKKSFRYYKITCTTSNKTCINPFCFIKNTRNESFFNAGCDIVKKVNKIYLHLTVSYRFLTQYRQIFSFPRFELCSLMNLTRYANNIENMEVPDIGIFNSSIIKTELLAIKDRYMNITPEKYHPCPLIQNDLKFHNMSSSVKFDFEKTFPDGDYRYEHQHYNDDDDNIMYKAIYEKFKTGEDSIF